MDPVTIMRGVQTGCLVARNVPLPRCTYFLERQAGLGEKDVFLIVNCFPPQDLHETGPRIGVTYSPDGRSGVRMWLESYRMEAGILFADLRAPGVEGLQVSFHGDEASVCLSSKAQETEGRFIFRQEVEQRPPDLDIYEAGFMVVYLRSGEKPDTGFEAVAYQPAYDGGLGLFRYFSGRRGEMREAKVLVARLVTSQIKFNLDRPPSLMNDSYDAVLTIAGVGNISFPAASLFKRGASLYHSGRAFARLEVPGLQLPSYFTMDAIAGRDSPEGRSLTQAALRRVSVDPYQPAIMSALGLHLNQNLL